MRTKAALVAAITPLHLLYMTISQNNSTAMDNCLFVCLIRPYQHMTSKQCHAY